MLEDMLRSYVIDFGLNWEKCLPFAEFAYNNDYHDSLGMSSFEALYGRKCRSLIFWIELSERKLVSLDLVHEIEDKVMIINNHLRTAQDRQKAYTRRRRKNITYEVGGKVFLKVSP